MDDVINDPDMPTHLQTKMRTYITVLNKSTSVIHSSTKQLSLTVNDMLALAQLDYDTFRINIESFDIREVV